MDFPVLLFKQTDQGRLEKFAHNEDVFKLLIEEHGWEPVAQEAPKPKGRGKTVKVDVPEPVVEEVAFDVVEGAEDLI